MDITTENDLLLTRAGDPRTAGLAALKQHTAAKQHGALILAGIFYDKKTVEQLAADQYAWPQAVAMKKASTLLFGRVRRLKAEKKKQAENARLCIQMGLSLGILLMISTQLRALFSNTENPAHSVHTVLREILKVATGWELDIRKQANKIVEAHNQAIIQEHDEKRRKAEARRLAIEEHNRKVRAQQELERQQHAQDSTRPQEPGHEQPHHPVPQPPYPENDDRHENIGGSEAVSEPLEELPLPKVPEKFTGPRGRVYFTRENDASGQRKMIMSGSDGELAAHEVEVDKQARALMRDRPELDLQEARYFVVQELLNGASHQVEPAEHETKCSATANGVGETSVSATDTPHSAENTEESTEKSAAAPNSTPRKPTFDPVIILGGHYKEFKTGRLSIETANSAFRSELGTIRTGSELLKHDMSRHRTFIPDR